jgi:molybdopterin synthase sulfur carrier subunit
MAAIVKIRVLYFAALREALGAEGESLDLPAAALAGDVRKLLASRGGAWADAFAPGQALACAINQEHAAWDAALADGAELAFFPPITGG